MRHRFAILAFFFALTLCLADFVSGARADDDLKRINLQRGIVAVIGLPTNDVQYLVQLCNASDLTVYFQTSDAKVGRGREAGCRRGRVFG